MLQCLSNLQISRDQGRLIILEMEFVPTFVQSGRSYMQLTVLGLQVYAPLERSGLRFLSSGKELL